MILEVLDSLLAFDAFHYFSASHTLAGGSYKWSTCSQGPAEIFSKTFQRLLENGCIPRLKMISSWINLYSLSMWFLISGIAENRLSATVCEAPWAAKSARFIALAYLPCCRTGKVAVVIQFDCSGFWTKALFSLVDWVILRATWKLPSQWVQ